MALIGIPIKEAILLTDLQSAFAKYARYFEDAPQKRYAIRVGSKTLLSDDTYDLRQQFEREVGRLKRQFGGKHARKSAQKPR